MKQAMPEPEEMMILSTVDTYTNVEALEKGLAERLNNGWKIINIFQERHNYLKEDCIYHYITILIKQVPVNVVIQKPAGVIIPGTGV
jgi:hypothetical protein